MAYETWNRERGFGGYVPDWYPRVGNGLAGNRFCQWMLLGGAPAASYPAAGGVVHGVTKGGGNAGNVWLAHRGLVAGVELGEAVTAGALLTTDAAGRAVNGTTSNQVGRALESGTAGQVIYFVFER